MTRILVRASHWPWNERSARKTVPRCTHRPRPSRLRVRSRRPRWLVHPGAQLRPLLEKEVHRGAMGTGVSVSLAEGDAVTCSFPGSLASYDGASKRAMLNGAELHPL